jgi:hypothetical protein
MVRYVLLVGVRMSLGVIPNFSRLFWGKRRTLRRRPLDRRFAYKLVGNIAEFVYATLVGQLS